MHCRFGVIFFTGAGWRSGPEKFLGRQVDPDATFWVAQPESTDAGHKDT